MTTSTRIPAHRVIVEAVDCGILDETTQRELAASLTVPRDEVSSAVHLGELLNAGHIDAWTLLELVDIYVDSDIDPDRIEISVDLRGGDLIITVPEDLQ